MGKITAKWKNKEDFNLTNLHPPQLIILGFASLIVIGTVLLIMPFATYSGKSVGFLDAFFTSTSAVCVTGLVVLDTGSVWNIFGKIVIITLIQAGGLGIMSLTTMFALILGKKMGLRERLFIQESLNVFSLQGVVRLFKHILIATFIIELFGALLLSIRFIPEYGVLKGAGKSIFHSISAFCNAGFDIFGTPDNKFTSLTGYHSDPLVVPVIGFLFVLGGLGFIVWSDLAGFIKSKRLWLHTKVVLSMTGLLIVLGTVLVLLFEYNNPMTISGMNLKDKIMNSFFHSITPRTAGFNTLPTGELTPITKFITMILMFIGAAPGSTGGGIKVTTISITILATVSYIKGTKNINVFKRRVPDNMVKKSLSIIVLSTFVVFVTVMLLLAANAGTFQAVLFEALSAIGTVGLSTGITPDLNSFARITLIVAMFLGRVGPITAAITFASRGDNKKDTRFTYADGKITVG